MDNQTTLEKLNEKVSAILKHYHTLKGENELLRTEIVTLRAQGEVKNQELEKLIQQNVQKDLEIEEIVDKIESIMG